MPSLKLSYDPMNPPKSFPYSLLDGLLNDLFLGWKTLGGLGMASPTMFFNITGLPFFRHFILPPGVFYQLKPDMKI